MQDDISNNPLESLKEIRKAMQQSSRIFSLSGLSGIWAGLVALAGTLWVGYILSSYGTMERIELGNFDVSRMVEDDTRYSPYLQIQTQQAALLYSILGVFVLAVTGAVYFSYIKNKKQGYKVSYNQVAQKLLINLSIPIGAAAIICLKLLLDQNYQYLVPLSLVFYGLALINCSKYTFTEIKYLGLFEVLLGLVALLLMRWHLWIWAFGFGVLHIIYGILMWQKYDKQ